MPRCSSTALFLRVCPQGDVCSRNSEMERPVLLYAGTVTSGNYGPSSEELGCARASHNCTFLSKSLHFSGPHFVICETEKMIPTMTVYELKVLIAQSCLTLQSCGLEPTRLLCLWDSPGKNTGVGCHSLIQMVFPTQAWNSGLLHCRLFFIT